MGILLSKWCPQFHIENKLGYRLDVSVTKYLHFCITAAILFLSTLGNESLSLCQKILLFGNTATSRRETHWGRRFNYFHLDIGPVHTKCVFVWKRILFYAFSPIDNDRKPWSFSSKTHRLERAVQSGDIWKRSHRISVDSENGGFRKR